MELKFLARNRSIETVRSQGALPGNWTPGIRPASSRNFFSGSDAIRCPLPRTPYTMSQQALVPCPHCKQTVSVEFRHAGQDRTCPACQHVFPAPKLRELKLLLPESDADTRRPKAVSSSYPLRNLLFVLGLGTALLGGISAYLVYQYSKTTVVFDEKSTKSYAIWAEENLESKTPAELWDGWDTILDARTLPAWELMGTEDIRRYSTTLQWAVRVFSGMAVLGLLCLACSFLFAKVPRGI